MCCWWPGTGKMTFQDGSWYYGDWRKGRRHGKGTHFDKIEQSRYAGEFQSGLRHGRGSLYVRHGEKKVGVWERGQMLRERSVEASQGSSPSSEQQSVEFRDADATVEAQMRESAARIGRMETDAARAAAAARGLADAQ
jgi:hypothetical protein